MQTRPVMISPNEANILFDDRSLLETAFGKGILIATTPNTNCDCIGYSVPDDEDTHTDQITSIAH